MIEIRDQSGGVVFSIRVVPRASTSEIVGEMEGAVKVRIASPPVDGAANGEVVKLLAKTFGVAKSSVAIVAGHTSKAKQIRIEGITAAEVRTALGY